MIVSRGDETREVLQPSLLSIPVYCGHGAVGPIATRDQQCVGDGIRDGASLAIINNVLKNLKQDEVFMMNKLRET